MSQQERAADLVRRVVAGDGGEDAKAMLYLFRAASDHGQAATSKADKLEREANALAAVVADLLVEARSDDALRQLVDRVVDDLPHDARQRVNAYRHQRDLGRGVTALNTFGQRLPDVPPRASVMRQRVNTIDLQPVSTGVEP